MIALAELSVAAYLVEDRGSQGGFVFVEINAAAATLWAGEPRSQMGPLRLGQAFPPEIAARIAVSFSACIEGQNHVERDSMVPVARGAVTVRTSLFPLATQPGHFPRLLGIVTDVPHERRMRDELEQSNVRLAVAIEALGGAHWFFDATRRTFDLSPGFIRLLDSHYKPKMSLEEWLACVHPEDRAGISFADQLDGLTEEATKEFRVRTAECDTRWLRCHRRPVRNDWTVIGVAGVVIDITAEKRREEMLSAQATTDPLTGLGNRRHLQDVLAKFSGEAIPDFAVLMIDVDRFKNYNDHYGHLAGDTVLKSIAGVLQTMAAPLGGSAFRYGGEEFLLILPDVDGAGAHCVAAALLTSVAALAHPHASSELGVVTVSIGGATRKACGGDLVANADAALYRAKRAGRNCFRLAGRASSETLAWQGELAV